MSQDGQPIPESVVRQAASGDRAAQEQLLAGLHDYVRKTLFRLLLGRPQDLDDLTQSALLKVLTALPSYRFEAALKTWATGICVNVVRDYLRKKTRRKWFEIPSETEPEGDASRPSANLQNQLEAREVLGECAEVLEGMSPNQRMAFWLRTVDGRSIEEIAEIMGSAKSTARMRVYYGRKAFKKGLRRQLSQDTGWRTAHLPDSPGGE